MKFFSKWIALDWVKLIVVVVLFFLMLLFWHERQDIRVFSVSALPPYPSASFNWRFEDGILLNPDGNKVYALTEDGKRWLPVIPTEVLTQLPAEYEVLQAVDGEWVILDEDGVKLAGLDPAEHVWRAVMRVPTATLTYTNSPIPTITNTPEPSFTPTVTETFTNTPTNTLTFTNTVTSSPTSTSTVTSTKTQIPSKTFTPTKTFTTIPSWTPIPSYTPWPSITPLPTNTPWPTATKVPPTATMPPTSAVSGEIDIENCPASAPSQLHVGDQAVALSNLFLRSVPYVGDNVITYNVVGAELTVIDGPLCKPHADGYYIWWLVESPYGLVGWTAETTLHTGEYLMVPVE